MTAKIGSPLFILRDECQKDLMAVLERLAETGFDGVEFLGLFGHKPAEIRKKLDSIGLKAVGDHVPFDIFVDNTGKVIEEHMEIGCQYLTINAPGADGLPGGKDYARTIESFKKIGEAMNAADMTLLFHNHAGELKQSTNGKSILENIMNDTDAQLLYLEPDLGWMRIGGAEPMYYLEKYRDRCLVVHFKDYVRTETDEKENFRFRPTGYGIMDNAVLYAKTLSFDVKPEWYITDHDCAYGRDIYFDLKISLEYLKNLMAVTGHDLR